MRNFLNKIPKARKIRFEIYKGMIFPLLDERARVVQLRPKYAYTWELGYLIGFEIPRRARTY